MVTKIPRFTFEKFPQADATLTTQMKSVGEVMAIGRTFVESLQKALRGLETGATGFDPVIDPHSDYRSLLNRELRSPGPERLWYVADALRLGMSVDEVYERTGIDPWFLAEIDSILAAEQPCFSPARRRTSMPANG